MGLCPRDQATSQTGRIRQSLPGTPQSSASGNSDVPGGTGWGEAGREDGEGEGGGRNMAQGLGSLLTARLSRAHLDETGCLLLAVSPGPSVGTRGHG